MPKSKSIGVYWFPLSEPKDKVFLMLKRDADCTEALDIYMEANVEENIEIFKRTRNIAVTETGYLVAIYENQMLAEYANGETLIRK